MTGIYCAEIKLPCEDTPSYWIALVFDKALPVVLIVPIFALLIFSATYFHNINTSIGTEALVNAAKSGLCIFLLWLLSRVIESAAERDVMKSMEVETEEQFEPFKFT